MWDGIMWKAGIFACPWREKISNYQDDVQGVNMGCLSNYQAGSLAVYIKINFVIYKIKIMLIGADNC